MCKDEIISLVLKNQINFPWGNYLNSILDYIPLHRSIRIPINGGDVTRQIVTRPRKLPIFQPGEQKRADSRATHHREPAVVRAIQRIHTTHRYTPTPANDSDASAGFCLFYSSQLWLAMFGLIRFLHFGGGGGNGSGSGSSSLCACE